jgi:hypothetical protein
LTSSVFPTKNVELGRNSSKTHAISAGFRISFRYKDAKSHDSNVKIIESLSISR